MSQDVSGRGSAQRLHELADRQEITELIGRLGMVLDEMRLEELREVFTADAVGEFPSGTLRGVAELIEYGQRSNPAFDRLQHLVTNVLVAVDGDGATARANMVSYNVPRGAEPGSHFDLGARYRFRAVRRPAGWRLSRVALEQVWTAGSMDADWLAQSNYRARVG